MLRVGEVEEVKRAGAGKDGEDGGVRNLSQCQALVKRGQPKGGSIN